MGYFLRYKLNLKIFLSFLLIIIITTVTALSIGYSMMKKSLEKEQTLRLDDSLSAYFNELKFKQDECYAAVKNLSEDSYIEELISSKDISGLEARLTPYYRMGLFDIIEVEDESGTVLIRAHDPEKSGDLKIYQKIIKEGLKGRSSVSFESGKSGIAIRAVAPVFSGGEITGLLMFGKLFSEDFVNKIKKLTGLESGIYRYDSKIISTYSGIDRISFDQLTELKETGKLLLRCNEGKNSCIYKFQALYNNNNEFWGAISLRLIEKDNELYFSYTGSLLFLMIMIGFFLSLFTYIILAANINHSLEKIINGINNFSINNEGTLIEVNSNDEFKIIASSINNLSFKLYNYNKQLKKLQDDMIKSAKLAAAGQMAAGLAHEIRNPLSSVKMMSQIIRSRYLKGNEGMSEISTVLEEIDRINNLITDLLEFSKPGPMNFSKYDINEIIKNVLNLHKYNIEHQNITVETKLDSNLPLTCIDSEKIKLCFINFIVNAVHAMPHGGILKVETEASDSSIKILISNTGEKILKKDIGEIFEPFFTTKKEGTGLGLAMTRLILERHYGSVTVESSDDITVFEIMLPLKLDDYITIV